MTWDKQKIRIYMQLIEMTVYHESIKSHKHVWLALILIKVEKNITIVVGEIKWGKRIKAYNYLSFSWLEGDKKW